MRAPGNRRRTVLSAAVILGGLCCVQGNASEIKQLKLDVGPSGTRAELVLDKPGAYRLIPLTNPERLAVDFPASHLAPGTALPKPTGVVTAVRSGQPVPGTVRLVFDLGSKVKAIPTLVEATPQGAVLMLEWPGDGPVAKVAPEPVALPDEPRIRAQPDPIARIASQPMPAPVSTPAAGPAAPPIAVAATPPSGGQNAVPTSSGPADAAVPKVVPQIGMRPLVIAIDAGHGGQDPGAHGLNGTREKDVTLAIARELARQINATPGLKAFLTRDSDVYIPLNHRARRASANNADLFLSIHADAAENRNARGSSVYVLSTRGASSQRARWLADKENAADIIGGKRVQDPGNTLTSVLLDLTQSGNMKASEDAADHVLGGLKRVGNNHKPEVERANFAVLRTSDKMPAMLVETAFISNPDEEKRLADPAFQRTIARAILDGIDTYFSRQPPPGTLYAARAQAAVPAASEPPARSGIGGSR